MPLSWCQIQWIALQFKLLHCKPGRKKKQICWLSKRLIVRVGRERERETRKMSNQVLVSHGNHSLSAGIRPARLLTFVCRQPAPCSREEWREQESGEQASELVERCAVQAVCGTTPIVVRCLEPKQKTGFWKGARACAALVAHSHLRSRWSSLADHPRTSPGLQTSESGRCNSISANGVFRLYCDVCYSKCITVTVCVLPLMIVSHKPVFATTNDDIRAWSIDKWTGWWAGPNW